MSDSMTAYVGATAIPGDGRAAIEDSVVLVAGGRIVAVGAGHTPIPADSERVDLTGRYLLPGLTEAHAHVSGFASEAYHPDAPGKFRAAPPLMEGLLRWGCTTVRDTGGPDLESTQNLQRHGQLWPRFFGSGPNLDGHPGGPWKGMWKTNDPAEVSRFVGLEADAGMDFIKLYAWMTEDGVAQAVRAAHRRGLLVAAHVGHAVTAERAVQLGVDALEHIRIGPELVPADKWAEYQALPAKPRDAMGSSKSWRYVDLQSAAVERVINTLVSAGTYLTPTLAISESHLHPGEAGDESLHHDDSITGELQYDAAESEIADQQFRRIQEFVGMAHAAGVHIVAGSDTPSPVLAPGESLHAELELLVQSGLSPLQAITAASYTAARLLGKSDHIGSLRHGNFADLLILNQDPLADIKNSRSIETVLLEGQVAWTATQA